MEFNLQQTDLWTTSMEEQTKNIDLSNHDDDGHPTILSPPRPSLPPPTTYHCIASLHRPDGNIRSIAMTTEFIFVGSEGGQIQAWKLPECPGVGFMKGGSGEVGAMIARGRVVFSSHGDCRVRIWNVKMGSNYKRFKPKKISTLPPKRSFLGMRNNQQYQHQHKDFISCLAYNQADNLLYTGSWDSTVKTWNISKNKCVDSFVAHEGQVNAMVLNQQDGCLFTSSSDASIKIWRRVFGDNSHILTMILKFQLSPVNALAFSLSSSLSSPSLLSTTKPCNFLYSGSSDGLVNFWEKESSSSRYNHGGLLQGHQFAVLCLVTIKDLILSGSEDTTIRVWRRQESANRFVHSCIAVIDGHHGPIRSLASAKETDNMGNILICSASLDQTFKVWKVKVNFSPSSRPLSPITTTNSSEMMIQQLKEVVGCEMNNNNDNNNPVLSPSWVENRRLQGEEYYVFNNPF